MHHRSAFVLAAAIPCLCSAGEPIGIKDFQIGGGLRAEADRAGLKCSKSTAGDICTAWDRDKMTPLSATIAGIVTQRVYLMGVDDKLGLVSFRTSAADWSQLRASFTGKYPEMKCADSVVENRMGAKFEQTVCELSSPTATLTLRRRSSDLTLSEVELVAAEYSEARKKAAAGRASEGKKDI